MEYVATQPLHDITPYKRQLRAEMDAIRAEMRRIGPLAEGPGHFALGQGYLALHQDDAGARATCGGPGRAGERGPEVAEALGLAFGRAYERALSDADRAPVRPGEETRRRGGRARLPRIPPCATCARRWRARSGSASLERR